MLRECYHGHTNLNSAERMLSRSCEHMSLWQKPVTCSCTPVPCWQNTITTTETDMLLWKYTTSYLHRPISCFLRMKIHDRKLIHTTTTTLRSVRMVLEVHTNLYVHHTGRPISCWHTYIMPADQYHAAECYCTLTQTYSYIMLLLAIYISLWQNDIT